MRPFSRSARAAIVPGGLGMQMKSSQECPSHGRPPVILFLFAKPLHSTALDWQPTQNTTCIGTVPTTSDFCIALSLLFRVVVQYILHVCLHIKLLGQKNKIIPSSPCVVVQILVFIFSSCSQHNRYQTLCLYTITLRAADYN